MYNSFIRGNACEGYREEAWYREPQTGCTSDTSERRAGRKDDWVRVEPFSESFDQASGKVLKPVTFKRSPSSGRNGAALVLPPCSALTEKPGIRDLRGDS